MLFLNHLMNHTSHRNKIVTDMPKTLSNFSINRCIQPTHHNFTQESKSSISTTTKQSFEMNCNINLTDHEHIKLIFFRSKYVTSSFIKFNIIHALLTSEMVTNQVSGYAPLASKQTNSFSCRFMSMANLSILQISVKILGNKST